jgi:VanZ family protein
MVPIADRAGDGPARPNQSQSPPANRNTPHDVMDSHFVHFEPVFVIVVIGIVFGSLYPFDFRVPPGGVGPLHTLLGSWFVPPGRGDAVANILFYLPFGLFAMLSFRHRPRLYRWLLVVIVTGALLSTAMELAQYFDKGRVTSAADVYTNTLGATLGAITGSLFRFNARIPMIDQLLSNPVPTVLIGTWVAYRLFPYEPTIDLHKYWDTLKPLLLSPTLSSYDLYRHTVIWLTVFGLIAAAIRRGRSMVVAISFAAGVLTAKVVIINASLSIAEIAGAVLALCLRTIFGAIGRRGLVLLAALLAGYIVIERLEPFVFLPNGRAFGWIPFASFLSGGSLEINILSFFEKVFLYGSLIFLLTEAGVRLWVAATLLAMLLFATSWIEIYLPGRSAEVTDAVMALLIAAVFSLLRYKRQSSADLSIEPT